MPSKKKVTEGAVAANGHPETPFGAVPYDTQDICTSISLLLSSEEEIVTKALGLISEFADKGERNVELLYKNGVILPLLELIPCSDITITKFALKLLGVLVSTIKAAAEEFLDPKQHIHILNINKVFISIKDPFVTEFASQILGHIVKGQTVYSQILQTGIISRIFEVLHTSEDADCQLNTLRLLFNLLDAEETPLIFSSEPEVSMKPLLCYLKHEITDLRTTAFNIIDKVIAWKNNDVQKLLREEHLVKVLFEIAMSDEYRVFHKKVLENICTSLQCFDTALCFIKSLEFVTFCEWAIHCPSKYILQVVTILETLTSLPDLRQVLFDYSFEDTLLTFFRIDDAEIFYKICSALNNMTALQDCSKKIGTAAVIQLLLKNTVREDFKTDPYQEIALRVLHSLIKHSEKAVDIMAACGGIGLIRQLLLKDKQKYTYETQIALFDMLLIFCSNHVYKESLMNASLFKMLLNVFASEEKLSQAALSILIQYTDILEYQNLFIQYNGPEKVLTKLTTTKYDTLFKDILLYIKRLLLYKNIGRQFLWGGAFKILSALDNDIKQEFHSVNDLLTLMYDLHLPFRFHKLGRLRISDVLSNRFYLINSAWEKEFPFLEVLEKRIESIPEVIYIVDFSADIGELTQKPMKLHESLSATDGRKTLASKKRSSLKRHNASPKSSGLTPKSPGTRASFASIESGCPTVMYTVPPPINYGFVSEDPYLPKYVEKLYRIIHSDSNAFCFKHQVSATANFVSDVLSGPDGIHSGNYNQFYALHIKILKEKLGTSIIPIGYLRCGKYCEKALLFKALADKVGIPATLVRGKKTNERELKFWNEVPLIVKDRLTYVVVDLAINVGKLYTIGTSEANKYCGLA